MFSLHCGQAKVAGGALAASPISREIAREEALTYLAGVAAEHAIPAVDLQVWREAAANPSTLLDDPDCCMREFFVLTVGRVAK